MNTNVQKATDEMMAKFMVSCGGIDEATQVKEGETKEEYINRMDAEIDRIHMSFNGVLVRMGEVTGYKSLVDMLYEIMDGSLCNPKTGKKDLTNMAIRFKELVDEEIDFLNELADEQSIKKVVLLKAYTEDSKGSNIFEVFISTIIHIGKRVNRKLRQWFKVDDEGSIMHSICTKLSFIGSTLRKGGKIVFNALTYAVGYVIAGAIKVVTTTKNFLVETFTKIKDWATAKLTKADNDETTARVVAIVQGLANKEESVTVDDDCDAVIDAYEEAMIAKLDKEIARKARIAEIKAEIERLQAQKDYKLNQYNCLYRGRRIEPTPIFNCPGHDVKLTNK